MTRKAASALVLAAGAAAWTGWFDVPVAWAQNRAKGLDASFSTVNFQTAASNGFVFGWVQSTNGSTTRAPFQTNMNNGSAQTVIVNGQTRKFLIGPYHFAQPTQGPATQDVQNYLTLNNAQAYMRPGFLLPVYDLEAGPTGTTAVSGYSIEWCDALYAAKGIYPVFYANMNYTQYMNASAVAKTEGLWIGRPSFTDAQAQTGNPDQAISNPYGAYGTYAEQPWKVWQYIWNQPLGSANIDRNVAHGDYEYIADLETPAVRVQGASGEWTAANTWRNITGNPTAAMNVWLDTTGSLNTITHSAGSTTVRRLGMDRDIFSMTGGTFNATRAVSFAGAATFSGGTLTTPTLGLYRRNVPVFGGGTATTGTMHVIGGTVNAGTIDVTTSTRLTLAGGTIVGNLNNSGTTSISSGTYSGVLTQTAGTTTYTGGNLAGGNVVLNGGTFSMNANLTAAAFTQNVAAYTIPTGRTLTLTGGGLTLGAGATLTLTASASAVPGNVALLSDMTYAGGTAAATITTGTAAVPGFINLGAGTRTFNVADGSAAVDLTLNVPLVSGSVQKTGAGVLALSAPGSAIGGLRIAGGTVQLAVEQFPGTAIPATTLAGGTLALSATATPTTFGGTLTGTGTVSKTGAATVVITGTGTNVGGTFSLGQGILQVTHPSQLGAAAVVSNTTIVTAGVSGYSGTLQVNGNGLTFANPVTITGGGAQGVSLATAATNFGALDNASGSNTWAGQVTLAGAGKNGSDPTENAIGAAAGSTLTVTGALVDGPGVSAYWVKTGQGDVVLAGPGANTYQGITRVFGGRVIVEKDAALGTGGNTTLASTFFLAGGTAGVAFRAPAGSGGFSYSTNEWLFTQGLGAGGAQIDNLGGDNTFAGSIGIGGPVIDGAQTGTIGVTAGSLKLTGGIYGQGSGVRNIVKVGPGVLTIAGDSAAAPANPSAGALASGSALTVSAGAVVLAGTPGGTANLPAVSSYAARNGGVLVLAQPGAIAPGAGIALSTGGAVRTLAEMSVTSGLAVGAGGGVVDAPTAAATFTGAITGTSGLTKAGAGRVVLGGDVSGFTGGVTVSQGTLALGGGGATGVLRMAALDVAGAVGVLPGFGAPQAGIVATAILDLNDSNAILDYTTSSSLDLVRQLLTTGARGADAADVDLTWGGPGITSTAARAIATHQAPGAARAIGYSEASAYIARTGSNLFDGVTVDDTAVLLRYTFDADATLDGIVTDADVDVLVAHYQDSARAGQYPTFFTDRRWDQGDFTFDGLVDDRDLDRLAAMAGTGVAGVQVTTAGLAKLAALRSVAVPEPAAATVAALGFIGMLRRRRRR